MNDDSNKMLLIAETMFKEGKGDQSVTLLENLITQEPNYLPAYSLLAVAYADQNKYDEVEYALQEGFRVGRTLGADQVINQVIKFLEDFLTQYPHHSLIYYLLGRAYTYQGEYNRAEHMLSKAMELAKKADSDDPSLFAKNVIGIIPDYSLAYYYLGHAYGDEGKYDKAEQILHKAIELNPNWHHPHLYLGWVYEQQQKLEQALASYQQAIKLKPDDFDTRTYLGCIYQSLGNQKEGVNQLQKAYQLKSDNVIVIYNLANGLQQLGRYTEALKLLDKATTTLASEAQDLANLYNLRGIIYLNLHRLDEAYADIQKAIKLDPSIPGFYDDLGDIYFENGQYEEAVNSYEKAINSDAHKGNALRGIGNSYLKLENWEAAVNFLEKAREIGEVDHFGLGLAYFELGDDERGIENLRNEILNDGLAKTEASYYLGFACATTGDRESSIKAFKQFLELSTDKADDPEWQEWRAEVKKQIEEQ